MKKKRNLSTLQHVFALQIKRLCVQSQMHLRLKSNALAFQGEFYQFNLSSCIRQQNSLTAQFVSFSLANLANIFYPPDFYNN